MIDQGSEDHEDERMVQDRSLRGDTGVVDREVGVARPGKGRVVAQGWRGFVLRLL